MGVGIGGDYPLSAVISSEFASTKIRGRMMTAVFANQGWGQLTAAIVATILAASALAAPPPASRNNKLEASKSRLQKDINAIGTVEKLR